MLNLSIDTIESLTIRESLPREVPERVLGRRHVGRVSEAER